MKLQCWSIGVLGFGNLTAAASMPGMASLLCWPTCLVGSVHFLTTIL